MKTIRSKRRAFICSKRTQSLRDTQQYKAISRKAKSLTKRDHEHHLEDLSNNLQLNPKSFWNWIANLRGGTCQIPELHYKGSVFKTTSEKCSVLNKYFASVFTGKSPPNVNSLHSLLGPPSSDTFLASIHILEADTYKILKEIDASKSCGPGDIPGRLLREGAAHLVGPLSQLFSLSIQTGTLPTDWKRSNVTLIFKKGSKSSPQVIDLLYQSHFYCCEITGTLDLHKDIISPFGKQLPNILPM